MDEELFKTLHHKHRTQVVSLSELKPRDIFDKQYICVSQGARDKAKESLDKTFNNNKNI